MDRVTVLEKEIQELRKLLNIKVQELYEIRKAMLPPQPFTQLNGNPRVQIGDKLPKWAIERYSRQILLPDIGVEGQEKLSRARVLIVGAGGLGCPSAMYLAAAGVGEIGIVDYDEVDITNIHRQVLHGESDERMSKAESAVQSLRRINSSIKVTAYNTQLDSSTSAIIRDYDIVLDCSDNVPTRYALNHGAVCAKVPLISGSALKMEGQLTIYGYRASKNLNEKEPTHIGPCYRCVFPCPPPPEAVGSCSASGVAGPVTGVIGALQALEAIKMIVGQTRDKLLVERMLLFDGEDITFKTVTIRPRNTQCLTCSEQATAVTQHVDFEAFCNAQAKEKKKIEANVNAKKRLEEKAKRMSGQSYYGFRTIKAEKTKWIQDVLKSERKLGPTCVSDYCKTKQCRIFTEENRKSIFSHFWSLDWREKKRYVRDLVVSVPPKHRRSKIKNLVSRKGESKLYHLICNENKLPVCRLLFLNTLGIKEAMLRCWLGVEKPKKPKRPVKALDVESYIDELPKQGPKCSHCPKDLVYLNVDAKNFFQLYNLYVRDTKSRGGSPASRKTFSKVISEKNIRMFKPRNESDVCDVISEHNNYVVDRNLTEVTYYYEQW